VFQVDGLRRDLNCAARLVKLLKGMFSLCTILLSHNFERLVMMQFRSCLRIFGVKSRTPTFQKNSRRQRERKSSGPALVERLEQRQLLSATPMPLGTTIDVNSIKPGAMTDSPVVASNASGNYVVVWSTALSDHTSEIDGQMHNATGTAKGGNFTISKSNSTAVELVYPSVAIDDKGDFVVTWINASMNSNHEVTGYSVRGQRYDFHVKTQATEFTIGTSAAQFVVPSGASVGMDSHGDFVVVWGSKNTSTPGIGEFVYAQVYNWSGTVKGSRITVATGDNVSTFAEFSTVAMNSKGDFVVAWQSFNGASISVKAQRYNLAGKATTSLITVSQGSSSTSQREPAVAIDPKGEFVVVWETGSFKGEGEIDSIHAQRYDSLGHAWGGAITVSQGDSITYENAPSVAMNSGGDFVVTWWNSNRTNSFTTVLAQAYKWSGQAQGSPITVARENTFETNRIPSVAINGCGKFVIAWDRYSLTYNGSSYSINLQRYRV
jgi:hypothetical protein